MTIIAIVALSLSSCDYSKEATGRKEVPLPGQRISVMLNEGELQADPRVSDLRVLLPTLERTPNWTQAGGNATHTMHHLKIRNTVVEDWDQSIGEGSSDEDAWWRAPSSQMVCLHHGCGI